MITRRYFIYVHMALAAFFLPYLLLMPFSGTWHLLKLSEDQTKSEAFKITGVVPSDPLAKEIFFREEFKKQNIDYSFEYVKDNGKDFTFRPTSRVYYTATVDGDSILFTKVNPGLSRRLMEIHKGHGPWFIRTLEIAFGVALILVTLSGLWLAFTVQNYRNIMLGSFALGAIVIVWALL
ncbi:MAG: hypothetical protein K2Q26_16180 [Bdellovibrionales bacterium]|nr:hypothetical protein [Bdellovibrionales bacterium]